MEWNSQTTSLYYVWVCSCTYLENSNLNQFDVLDGRNDLIKIGGRAPKMQFLMSIVHLDVFAFFATTFLLEMIVK